MDNPLEARFSRYMQITYAEREALRWLKSRERGYAAGEIVVREDHPLDTLHIVASGWLHASVQLKGGGRQILRFYFIGDITTAFSIAWEASAATLTAVSPCTLFEMPRTALGQLFRDHPRLGALLYGISAAEHVAMADRLTSIGRTDGMTRIATLLLDIRSRLRIADGIDGATFALPLTQQDLGDAVGLTKTHVNRALKSLSELGLIEREGKVIRITDVAALSAMVGFRDRHRHVAIDWLPGTGQKGDMDHPNLRIAGT